MRHILVLLATLGLAGIGIACGGSSTVSPSSPVPQADLSSTPTHIVADGRGLTLTASLWRDFMPICPPDGQPLLGVLRIKTDDGTPVPASIGVGQASLVHGTEVWVTAAVQEQPRESTAPAYEVVVRGGPKWEPGGTADVVAWVRDSAGQLFLLRSPDQVIQRSE